METNETTPAPKISFGFKSSKAPAIKLPANAAKKTDTREFIKSINDGDIEATVKKEKEEALIISMPTSTKSYREKLTARAPQIKAEVKLEEQVTLDTANLSLEKRAELEILSDFQKKSVEESNLNFVIPAAENVEISGAKEATLDDYESIPVVGFGLAMLRGMGLKEEPTNNKKEEVSKTDEFKFRPKGMGLGADSTVRRKELKIAPKPGQVLTMKKGAFIVVLGGSYKDFYGEVKGFDDNNGRVIVKLALGQRPIMLGEKFVQLVTAEEFQKYSKIPVVPEIDKKKSNNGSYGLIASSKSSKNDTQNNEVDEEDDRNDKSKETRRDRSSSSEKYASTSRQTRDTDRSRKNNKHRSRSRDKDVRELSRQKDRRSRSRDKYKRSRSRDTDRRDRTNDRNRRSPSNDSDDYSRKYHSKYSDSDNESSRRNQKHNSYTKSSKYKKKSHKHKGRGSSRDKHSSDDEKKHKKKTKKSKKDRSHSR